MLVWTDEVTAPPLPAAEAAAGRVRQPVGKTLHTPMLSGNDAARCVDTAGSAGRDHRAGSEAVRAARTGAAGVPVAGAPHRHTPEGA
ncbi:MAG TPA: hypothetical protein VIH59_28345, partial [Candidatus Tectomicrobia bacterium]